MEAALVEVMPGMLGGVADVDAQGQVEVLAGSPEWIIASVAVGDIVDGGGEQVDAPSAEPGRSIHLDYGVLYIVKGDVSDGDHAVGVGTAEIGEPGVVDPAVG